MPDNPEKKIRSDIQVLDEGLSDYLKAFFPRVVYAPTNRARYTVLRKNPKLKDNDIYPYISFYRDANVIIDYSRYDASVIKGDYQRLRRYDPEGQLYAVYHHSIPVTLNYQVDIWSDKQADAMKYSQALVLKLMVTDPVLFIKLGNHTQNGGYHILDVKLVDNSDLEAEESRGRLYRHTITFHIAGWMDYIEQRETTPWVCPKVDIQ